MTARRMSTTRRRNIFVANGGRCHICGDKIDGTKDKWDVEHIIPLEISRDDTDENLAPAHASCHKIKTKKDAADIAKCKRVEAKHNGWKKPKRKIGGRRFDGSPIYPD